MKKYGRVFAVLLSAMLVFSLTGCNEAKYAQVYNRKVPSFSVRADGTFRILQITDTHFLGGKSFDRKTMDEVEKAITTLDYDLVVMTGDLVINEGLKLYYNKYSGVRRFAELMEKHSVYWAYAIGNHDGAIIGNNESIIKTLLPYPHCIIANAQGVDGESNFFVDLKQQDKTVHSLIVMDSHDKNEDKDATGYDYIKKNQMDWYQKQLEERGNVPSTLFMHIPLPEFRQADEAQQFDPTGETIRLDAICAPDYNSGFFSLIKKINSTGMVAVGHDHNNRWGAWYQGVYFLYARASGYNAWGLSEQVKPGVTLLTIDTKAGEFSKMYTAEDIKYQDIKK